MNYLLWSFWETKEEILLSFDLVKLNAFLCYFCVFWGRKYFSFLLLWICIDDSLLGLWSRETRLMHFFFAGFITIYWWLSHFLSLPMQLKKQPSFIAIILLSHTQIKYIHPQVKSLILRSIDDAIQLSHILRVANILLYHMLIEGINILFRNTKQLSYQSFQGLIYVIIDLHILILLLQPQQIENIIPLTLLLYHIDIVVY